MADANAMSGTGLFSPGKSPGLRVTGRCYATAARSSGMAVSSARDATPSLPNTLRRWKSTVRGLRNSRAATSRLARPCRTRPATCRSWAVSAALDEASRRRAVSPEARSSWAAGRPPSGVEVVKHLQRRPQMAPGVHPPASPAQVLAVGQLDAGPAEPVPGGVRVLDRRLELRRDVAVTELRPTETGCGQRPSGVHRS